MTRSWLTASAWTVCAATMLLAARPALADDSGVSENSILFGQSAAFSGPASDLGINMRLGIETAFWEANQQGGVHGRQLELESLDDAYEPQAAITNTRKLVNESGVFALIGAVGTPTSRSATPIAAAAGVPYIAPFTGATFLREPERKTIINLRASYDQETEEIVNRLIRDLGINRIGVFYQDDSYGHTGYRGVVKALQRRQLELVSSGTYERNTTAIKRGLLDVYQGNPDAVVLVGAYQPIATMIRWSKKIGFDPVFVAISFVGTNALAQQLGPDGTGVYITQVVPFPMSNWPPVNIAYRQALAGYAQDAVPNFVSLEGYLAGRLAITAAERCGQALDRDCFINRLLEAESIDLDGFKLYYGNGDNQGSDAVFLTIIDNSGYPSPIQTFESEVEP